MDEFDFSAHFSIDDRSRATKVVRLYNILFGRPPDLPMLAHLTKLLGSGTNFELVVRACLDGEEFKHQRPTAEPLSSDDIGALCGAIPVTPAIRAMTDPAIQLATIIEAEENTTHASLMPALHAGHARVDDDVAYHWWAEECAHIPARARDYIEQMNAAPRGSPIISFVMHILQSNESHVLESVRSVVAQVHTNFQLVLILQGPLTSKLVHSLQKLARADPRIRVVSCSRFRTTASAWNKALESCTGTFLGIIGAGDMLNPAATLEFAAGFQRWPDAQIMFCDEDIVAPGNIRRTPCFKAAFDFDRMLIENYLGRLAVFRLRLLRQEGGWRSSAKGAEEYDFALRAAAKVPAAAIRHLPHLLYHRGTAMRDDEGPASRAAVSGAFLEATEPGSRITQAPTSMTALSDAVPWVTRHRASPAPLVSIVIPTRDRVDLLKTCIESLRSRTAYPRIEIIIVDNGSEEPGTLSFLAELSGRPNSRVLAYPGKFNWGALNNAGIRAASGEILLLLNNDTEAIHAGWLDELANHVMRPGIGAVGAKLVYPATGRLQHGGMVVAPGGSGRHVFLNSEPGARGFDDALTMVRTVSAVTGACMAFRRSVYDEVGGIEQEALQVTYSDVDFCFRVRERGYRVVWTPFARLIHDESATRGADDDPEKRARTAEEQSFFFEKWKLRLPLEPYFSPNLSFDEPIGVLAAPPNTRRAWDH